VPSWFTLKKVQIETNMIIQSMQRISLRPPAFQKSFIKKYNKKKKIRKQKISNTYSPDVYFTSRCFCHLRAVLIVS